jgi:hypothetical protein
MDRREILNELQQIVAVTDPNFVGIATRGVPEAARRAKGLIQVIESWPTAFPPAPFVSDQCAERHHGDCQLGSANAPFNRLCKCACHCPPEAPQQPADVAPADVEYRLLWTENMAALDKLQPFSGKIHRYGIESAVAELAMKRGLYGYHDVMIEARPASNDPWPHPAEAPQQPAEPAPAAVRHIDTPDELLELLAGVSSDPQVEGLSLSQKASTMALLYAAKALQQIADSQGHFDSGEIADAILICCGNLDEDKSPADPAQPS